MGWLRWLGLANVRPLDVGDVAPPLSCRDENGGEVHLAELYAKGWTLIYFYPKADTPGCTAQACSLRDEFDALTDLGVRIIGVSSDDPAAQLRFRRKHELPFTLLADTRHEIAEAFGVPLMLGMTRRQAFLVHGGKVVWRDLHASTRKQARDVLRFFLERGTVGA
jgi:peroxiredoxin Q/BCP